MNYFNQKAIPPERALLQALCDMFTQVFFSGNFESPEQSLDLVRRFNIIADEDYFNGEEDGGGDGGQNI